MKESNKNGQRKGKWKGKAGKSSCRMEQVRASTVMFVPWTSKGELISRLKEEEERLVEMTGFKVKYQEEGGTPLWLMFSTTLVEGVECGRERCMTCKQNDDRKVDCFASSVVYKSSCQLCHPPGTEKDENSSTGMDKGEGTYVGGTSRSVDERVGEHYVGLEALRKDSHMVKHWFTSHSALEEAPPFKFEVIGRFKDCLTRQLKEAVMLQARPNSLNSKGEFGRCEIPRLVIEEDSYKTKIKELEDRKKEEEDDRKWKDLVERVRKEKTGEKRKTPPWMEKDPDPTTKRIKAASTPSSLLDSPVPPPGPDKTESSAKQHSAGTDEITKLTERGACTPPPPRNPADTDKITEPTGGRARTPPLKDVQERPTSDMKKPVNVRTR